MIYCITSCVYHAVIKSSEITQIAEKISKYCSKSNIDIDRIAETFVQDFKMRSQFAKLKEEKLLNEILDFWQREVSQNRNGGPEPRRALAQELSKLGDKISRRSGEQYIHDKFEKLAKVCV